MRGRRDGVKAVSDNTALVHWAPVVTEIGVNFPRQVKPRGMGSAAS
ncbi:hypothetical protein IVA88_19345 [Bradyrhizobium sp. 149]|nr:hypothetical protein [Bradyrhizobium sp. 149]MCK1653577.1 hypothetical protein [Bradyrhizobium sp. 149]